MEIATTTIGLVIEHLMVPVKEHLRYLISYRKYVRDMGTQKTKLDATVSDVEKRMEHNKSNTLEVPSQVDEWLKRVGEIDNQVKSIPHENVGCFNLLARYKSGRKAFMLTEDIDHLATDYSRINWTDHPIPLGKVDSMKAPTSTPSSHHNDVGSRELIFMEALEALGSDQKSHIIALCGMGGVGKTTMMEKLKKVVTEKKMFNLIVKVVMGENTDIIAVQDAVADYLGITLTEKSVPARADRLQKSFHSNSDGDKKKILVILDDVWQCVDLNVIGLGSLPNEGVGVKFLITSRDEGVCTKMASEAYSLFKVNVMEEQEAQRFFNQFVEISNDDPELHKIQEDIIRKCCGLPIALKTLACTLKDKGKDAWEDALSRLEHHDIGDVVHSVFKTSYKNLQDRETKSIFLLCVLFVEDFDIPIEDLVRYGWGLKLFNKIYTIREARNRVKTCIQRLVHANLLIRDQDAECVKMHDLVRAFLLEMCSEGEQGSIVGDMSKWPEKHISRSCKQISLTCRGVSKFPKVFKFPELSLLKLMLGDDSLKLPDDLYENMEKLEVIIYEKIRYPLLPTSPQCSINLRTLCLHNCTMMFDCSSIGNLSNLEVLSFADSGIQRLPSAIGKLKKLKLLDLTGCSSVRIDDGVLENLVELEELYMISPDYGIRLTNANRNELVGCSRNLTGLEIEFSKYDIMPRNMSYKNLKLFKISLGCYLKDYKDQSGSSFENILTLVTKRWELLDSGINELFGKTQVLHFQVDDINNLGDSIPESWHHNRSSFYSLRVLDIHECPDLRYLFTVQVANGLTALEHLTVSWCPVIDTLVFAESSITEAIKLPALKFLYLGELPKLMCLCNSLNAIELPQLEKLVLNALPNFTSIFYGQKPTACMSSDTSTMQPLFNKEVVISRLKELTINKMERLKEIWPSDGEELSSSSLRMIRVVACDSLVNLFPSNPMSLLPHLEDLQVRSCGSIEVLFNIDIGCDGEMGEVNTCLKNIQLMRLDKLREVWRIKGANNIFGVVIRGFEAIEHLQIVDCRRFRNVFKPITVNFYMRALKQVVVLYDKIYRNKELVRSSLEQENDAISMREISEVDDTISSVAFPSYLMHTFLDLERENGQSMELKFEKENLKYLNLTNIERMGHMWKSIWNKVLISQELLFHNLTTIGLKQCENITYLFSPLMIRLLPNIKDIKIEWCNSLEEIVSNRDAEDTFTNVGNTIFPHLDVLFLEGLPNLKFIGAGATIGGSDQISFNITPNLEENKVSQVDDSSRSVCQYCRSIVVTQCDALLSVIPTSSFGQMQKLENLIIGYCESLKEVFESQGMNNARCSTNPDEGSDEINTTLPRVQNINVPQLSNLNHLYIQGCDLLQHVFTFSTLESLQQLEGLDIRDCEAMNVIVKEESEASKVVEFPRLKSINLSGLPNLTGFFLGMNKFRWPLLAVVSINNCPQMKVFTSGHSISPKLNYIHRDNEIYSFDCGLNFQTSSLNLDGRTQYPTTSEGKCWSFRNLIEMRVNRKYEKFIVPSNELQELQKLEKICLENIDAPEEVFEAMEGGDSGWNELQSVVKIPNLREVELVGLYDLKYIWKNNPWMRLEFPSLTKVSIHGCERIQYVFTSSMVGSLLQLQELSINDCKYLKVIVKEEDTVPEKEEGCDAKVSDIILPHLRSIKLNHLERLEAFCLGDGAISMPSLDTLGINYCPAMSVFTKEDSITPKLRVIETVVGGLEVRENLNSFLKGIKNVMCYIPLGTRKWTKTGTLYNVPEIFYV